jgi:4-hydroxy-2-oxoheptanedioate aldolase
MRKSRIKSKLRDNQPVLITALQLTDPVVFELASLMGFDGIWMDMEHHSLSLETAGQLMRAARVGCSDIIARPAKGEFMRMGRMLEAGAHGIMYPRCENAEEAAQVVQWSKFAPLGQRGFDSGNSDNPFCSTAPAQYVREANEETFIIVQLESPSAVDRAAEIARVEGVDALMFGPGDFSIMTGTPGQWDHALADDALRRIADAARSAGKHWGTPGFGPERAPELLDRGARLLFGGGDLLLVKAGLEQLQQDYAPLGLTFENRLAALPAEEER